MLFFLFKLALIFIVVTILSSIFNIYRFWRRIKAQTSSYQAPQASSKSGPDIEAEYRVVQRD